MDTITVNTDAIRRDGICILLFVRNYKLFINLIKQVGNVRKMT